MSSKKLSRGDIQLKKSLIDAPRPKPLPQKSDAARS
jgi:hypothetical protein